MRRTKERSEPYHAIVASSYYLLSKQKKLSSISFDTKRIIYDLGEKSSLSLKPRNIIKLSAKIK